MYNQYITVRQLMLLEAESIMRIAFILILVIGFGIQNSNAQWIQTDGPYSSSNSIAAFEFDSKYFTSISKCGFFTKPKTGNSWQLLSDFYFKTFTIKGDSLFAVTQYFEKGFSRDIGIQLINLNNPEASPTTIDSFANYNTLVHTDTCLFGAHGAKGFFQISFDGKDLKNHNNGLPVDTVPKPRGGVAYLNYVSSIVVTDDFIFCGTKNGVYRAKPDLNTWNEANNGLPKGNTYLIKEIADTLYTVSGRELFYSINNGNDWFYIYKAPSKITSFQKRGQQMFIGTSDAGVYNSADNGANWTAINAGLTDLSVNFLKMLEEGLFCGTTTGGPFRYENGEWVNDNNGIVSSFIKSMAVSNNNIIASSYENVHSLDPTATWSNISPNVNHEFFGSIASRKDTIFVSVEFDASSPFADAPFILYSLDKGSTWQNLKNPVPFAGDDPYNIHFSDGTLYANENGRMYYTDNFGQTWTDISLPSEYCNGFNGFLIYNSTPFATACGSGELLKLNDNNQWVLSNLGLPSDRPANNLAFCDSALFTSSSTYGIYVSFDNGNFWSFANRGTERVSGFRDFAPYGQHLFVATGKGVFVTSNYGQDWKNCNEGLINLNTNTIVIKNDTLFVGTNGNGVWKRAIDELDLSINYHEEPEPEAKLYPNPATDYLILKEDEVIFNEVVMIDIHGRRVLSKQVTSNVIDLRSLPNGTYIMNLHSDSEVVQRKIVISR